MKISSFAKVLLQMKDLSGRILKWPPWPLVGAAFAPVLQAFLLIGGGAIGSGRLLNI